MAGHLGSPTLEGVGDPAMTHSHPRLLGGAIATSGTRQISYKLVPGEASWQLKPMRIDTY